jgi:hypothetical protein
MVRQGQQKGKNRPDMSRQGKWQGKEQDKEKEEVWR